MELSSTLLQIFYAALIFIAGLFVVVWKFRFFNSSIARSASIYLWHTVFCFVNFGFSIENSSDSVFYYISSLAYDVEFGLGTKAVIYFTSFFSGWLGFSYLDVFLIFNIFGTIGLLAYDGALRRAATGGGTYVRWVVAALVFMPSVSFWSCALGKDAITFMAVGLIVWSAPDLGRKLLLVALSVAAIFLVRPHIAAVVLMAMIISALFYRRIPIGQRAFLSIILLAATAFLTPIVLNYVGFSDGISSDEVSDFVEQRQGYYQDTSAGVDLAAMSLPMQMFTYIFRPLPFEVGNLFSLVTSLENTFLLLIFLVSGINYFKNGINSLPNNWIFISIYSITVWGILAMTTANLGIAVRQKWMFVPMLVLMAISILAALQRSRRHLQDAGRSRL